MTRPRTPLEAVVVTFITSRSPYARQIIETLPRLLAKTKPLRCTLHHPPSTRGTSIAGLAQAAQDLERSAGLGNIDAKKQLSQLRNATPARGGSKGLPTSGAVVAAAATAAASPDNRPSPAAQGSSSSNGPAQEKEASASSKNISAGGRVAVAATERRASVVGDNGKLQARLGSAAGEELTFGGASNPSSWGGSPVPDVDGDRTAGRARPVPAKGGGGGGAGAGAGLGEGGHGDVLDGAGVTAGKSVGGGGGGFGFMAKVLEIPRRRRPRPGSPGNCTTVTTTFTPMAKDTDIDTFPPPHPLMAHASVRRCFVSTTGDDAVDTPAADRLAGDGETRGSIGAVSETRGDDASDGATAREGVEAEQGLGGNGEVASRGGDGGSGRGKGNGENSDGLAVDLLDDEGPAPAKQAQDIRLLVAQAKAKVRSVFVCDVGVGVGAAVCTSWMHGELSGELLGCISGWGGLFGPAYIYDVYRFLLRICSPVAHRPLHPPLQYTRGVCRRQLYLDSCVSGINVQNLLDAYLDINDLFVHIHIPSSHHITRYMSCLFFFCLLFVFPILAMPTTKQRAAGDVWAVLDRQWWLRWQCYTGCDESAGACDPKDAVGTSPSPSAATTSAVSEGDDSRNPSTQPGEGGGSGDDAVATSSDGTCNGGSSGRDGDARAEGDGPSDDVRVAPGTGEDAEGSVLAPVIDETPSKAGDAAKGGGGAADSPNGDSGDAYSGGGGGGQQSGSSPSSSALASASASASAPTLAAAPAVAAMETTEEVAVGGDGDAGRQEGAAVGKDKVVGCQRGLNAAASAASATAGAPVYSVENGDEAGEEEAAGLVVGGCASAGGGEEGEDGVAESARGREPGALFDRGLVGVICVGVAQ